MSYQYPNTNAKKVTSNNLSWRSIETGDDAVRADPSQDSIYELKLGNRTLNLISAKQCSWEGRTAQL